jgi:hypothetical protein
MMDSTSTGKLALAAMAKTSPTMKAMFWFSNTTPSAMASRLMTTAAAFETRTSSCSSAWPRRRTRA